MSRRFRVEPYLYLGPAVLVLGVFFLGSLVQVMRYSLTRYSWFAEPEFVGLANYETLLSSGRFWLCLGNSFAYLLVTPALVAVSLACALVVDSGIRGARGFRLVFFLPVVTPTIVAAIAWRLLYNEDSGLLNSVLEWIGLGGVGWLTQPPWTLISAMIVTLWKGFGFYMMIFLAGLLAVPRELKEAAAIDGAGLLATFRSVTLPALWPIMTLVIIISSIAALKVFDELFVTVRGVPIEQQTVVPLVYQVAFEEDNFGLACAAGVMLFFIILVFSLVNVWLTGAGKEGR